jgi:hypothetical protein
MPITRNLSTGLWVQATPQSIKIEGVTGLVGAQGTTGPQGPQGDSGLADSSFVRLKKTEVRSIAGDVSIDSADPYFQEISADDAGHVVSISDIFHIKNSGDYSFTVDDGVNNVLVPAGATCLVGLLPDDTYLLRLL